MEGNPLARGVDFAKAYAGAMVFAYIISIMLGLYFLEASSFQRLGSLWIAVLILLFGFSKLAMQQVKDAISGRGEQQKEAQEKLKSVTFSDDKGWLNYMSKEGVVYTERLHTNEEIQAHFADFESRAIFYIASNELLLATLATLQWGYGDLLHCLINGKGWATC